MIKTKRKHILACDPSLRAWGYAVISLSGEVIKVGCIKTEPENKKRKIRKGDDNVRRTKELTTELKYLIDRFNIQLILTEQPHGSQSASSAVMVGLVLGILQSINTFMDIPIEWYSEADSKKALLGKKSASKEETKNKIKRLYDVMWTGVGFRDEAIADALSIYHTALRDSTTLKILMSQ